MANFFDKAFNKIDNKQEPVRVVEDTTETKVTNYKDFNDQEILDYISENQFISSELNGNYEKTNLYI